MDALIAKLVEGTFSSADEKALYGEHQRHFSRRVRALDVSFFPGREKNPGAIESLGNGAYASFKNEPCFEKKPAFFYTHVKKLPATGFLYYWRASATIQYLRREGPELLRDRFRVLRNLRIHLHAAFVKAGERGGEDLYAPKEWAPRAGDVPSLDELRPAVSGLRGKALLSAIFEAAGVPLTRSELAKVLLRLSGVRALVEVALAEEPAAEERAEADSGRRLLEREVTQRTQVFLAELTEEERRLLVLRGHGSEAKVRRSFREVAAQLGRLKEESYRLMERRILERFRDTFPEREEAEIAVTVLVRALGQPNESGEPRSVAQAVSERK